MSSQPAAPSTVPFSLSERLQAVTEALAATRTQQDVFGIVLTPALQALDAVAGAVLLVDETGECLKLAATQGHEEGGQTLWQDGPLDGNVPAGDALDGREPLFFEHEGDLLRAYPELETRTGDLAPVATTVLPMFLDDRPLGVIVLDFKEPHRFTPQEARFLRTLAAQCAIALGRVRLMTDLQRQVDDRLRQMEDNVRAHEAFVAFTEAVGTSTDVIALARQAIAVLRARFPDGNSSYFEYKPGSERWEAQAWSENHSDSQVAMITAGFPHDTPIFADVLRTSRPVFRNAWDAQREQMAHTGMFGSGTSYPLVVDGSVQGILGMAVEHQQRWEDRDKALVRAVGRGLNLALERAAHTRRLAVQNAELDSRNRALEAFEEWSRDFTLDAEPSALIQRAQDLLHTLLPLDAALYYEREGGRWRVKSMRGEYGSEGLRQAHEAGLPHDTTDNLRIPFETGEPYYQNAYDIATDGLAAQMTHVSATAMLPLRTLRGVRGIFGLAKFGRLGWTSVERTTLETVRRSLELALDRADQVTELAQERAALRRRTAELADANEELEVFSYSVSHDLRAPVRHVLSFNQLLRQQLGEGLDAKTTRYLTVVEEAAGRMNTLIDAMLDLARTSRLPLRLRPVDLGVLVQTVRMELEADALEREVEWHIQPLPLVDADYDTLRQVITNLLDNALKYTRTREVTRIGVSAEEGEHEWVVSVRDNGVGFDPRYSNKLFGVFQRLHRAEDFEGTGVGLANVRRIITRHHGRVWASGTPGGGATFAFTLPKPH